MAGQGNAAPVIIKRKKIVVEGGHHGGAWKVAYADFVTAMMTFFLLMWLLNATTEKQRKGIADYFSPNIPINRVSGGGDGAFGGDSVFSETVLAQNGTGASSVRATADHQASGLTGVDPGPAQRSVSDTAKAAEAADPMKKIEATLLGRGGETNETRDAMHHIVTRVTDEGLIVEIFDLDGAPLFVGDTSTPAPITQELAGMMADVFRVVTNPVAVNGHVRSYPVVLRNNPAWDLSTARAQAMRDLLQSAGLDRLRVRRVSGFADRAPAVTNPTAPRNNRIEVILLRDGK
ncbi:MAG: OmpA family protein [Rhodobacteraceae bacterium]|nr:OmpA family protein [Paracoccaceae bacterium]